MKPTDEQYLQHLDDSIKEIGRGGWQQEITDGFVQSGRNPYHTTDARHSPKGYPDTIVPFLDWWDEFGRCQLIVIEAKVGGNKPTNEQLWWLDAYARCGAMTFALWPRHRTILHELYAGRLESPLVQERLHVYEKRG